MKKLAFITSEMTGIGGVATVVKRLTDVLKKDFEVIFIGVNNNFSNEFKCIEFETQKYMSKSQKIRSVIIRAINKYTKFLNNERNVKLLKKAYFSDKALAKLKEILDIEKVDCCIATAGANSMLLGYLSEEIDAHCIGWQLNSYDAYFNNKYKYMWHQNYVFKDAVKRLDAYVVLNDDDREKMHENMNIEAKVIHNPTSYESDVCSTLDNKVFMAAGHLWEGKGFDLLIDSFSIFCKKNEDWLLHIYGVGPDGPKLEEQAKKLGLVNKVIFKGNIPDTKEAFLQASVFCLSSRWEGMPMITLESLEMGVPIISYDISAIKPIIDNNENGIVVDKFDVDKFAIAMEKLAHNDDDRKLYGKNAKIKSKEFNIDFIVSKWKDEFSRNKEC